jgi:hypothetical protein
MRRPCYYGRRIVLRPVKEPADGVRGNMTDGPRRKFHPVYLLLLVPYVALLWVPFYNRIEPTLFGIPFFYWFQMLWIVGGIACLYPVYRHENRK